MVGGVKVRDSLTDRLFMIVIGILLLTITAIVLVPLIYVVASSFSSPQAVVSGQVSLWPVDFTTRGYETALANPRILTGFFNTIMYTAGGTAISVAMTVLIAYPLSRPDLPGRNIILGLLIFTMLFQGGLIPTFLVVKSLGMLNTPWALLIPNAIGVWQVLIAITYFRETIPSELYQAARIDGATDRQILMKIVLPLSKPMLAVIALMYAIGQWNSYFDALIYIRSPELYPLQLVLREILILNQISGSDVLQMVERQQLSQLLKFSLVVVSTVPILLFYPFVAKYFTKGMLVGSVKG
jgi:putative aldouronate transport system permease protein